jgi:glycerate kinase
MARIVVASDSFKGSLSAERACRAIARGLAPRLERAQIVICPMADGGDGTGEVLRQALGGEWVHAEVEGPRAGHTVEARYLWLPGERPGALVEMAAASGLTLLTPAQRQPLHTTTAGTGELMRHARERGARRLWLTLGGSATVDGGTGAATALGWRFLDREGKPVPPGGGSLTRVARCASPDGQPVVPPCRVLCDVDNPLLGPRGAARVFGPQKGAGADAVERLEAGLAHLADLIERDCGLDVRNLPGGGAAGGFGAGAVAFFAGEIIAGGHEVAAMLKLGEQLAGADWVVTGEGRFDAQSLDGKVVSAVLAEARSRGVKVAVIAGSTSLDVPRAAAAGVLVLAAVGDEACEPPPDEAERNLEAASRELAERIAHMP